MSTQLSIYWQDCYDLARTLKIKSKFLAYNIELGVGIVNEDADWQSRPQDQWRYYLNLAGEYHAHDTRMTVLSLDTQTIIPFDKATLANHPTTRREYAIGSTYYLELVRRYPKQEHLIISILNPIDLTTAINAEEGEILWYREDLVEGREANLIEELQLFIHRHYRAHLTSNYIDTTDNAGMVFLWNLYQQLPVQIQAIRLNNCKTDYAHSFHIWRYLDGYNRLARYQNSLTEEQTLYLYRNIERIHNAAGNNEIFEELVNVFLRDRNINVSNYLARHNTSEQVDNLKPHTELVKARLGENGKLTPTETVLEISTIMERGVNTSADQGEFLDLDSSEVQTAFDYARFDTQRTRTFEVEMTTTNDIQEYTLDDWLTNMWPILAIGNQKYNTTVAFDNPITDELHTLSISDAYIFYLYCYFKTLGVTLEYVPEVWTSIGYRDGQLDRESLLKLEDNGLLPKGYIENMLKDLPSLTEVKTSEQFFAKVSEFHERWKAHVREFRSLEKLGASSMGNLFLANLYRCWYIDPVGGKVDYRDWLLSKNLRVENFTDEHFTDLTLILFSEATGSVTSQELKLTSIQNAMVSIVKQLSAYNMQFLQTLPQDNTFSLSRKAVRFSNPTTDSIAGTVPLGMGTFITRLRGNEINPLGNSYSLPALIPDKAIEQSSLTQAQLGHNLIALDYTLKGEARSADMGHLRFGINFSNLHVIE